MRTNQGRGRGRNNSSRGRGRGRNHGRNFNGNKNSNSYGNSNTIIYKFYPHTAGKQQSVTYDSVKDHIIKQIQKAYHYGQDIATTLVDLKLMDLNQYKPTRMVSQDTDEQIRKQEQGEK